MSTISSFVNFSIDCTTSTASSLSYPVTAVPGYDAVVIFELINEVFCMRQHIVEKEYHTVEYYQDSLSCEKIVLSHEDFATITNHLESVEPVDNPNLKNLFTRYSK
jgi:hypothetical protein